MRRFWLTTGRYLADDEKIAEGVVFTDGHVVMSFLWEEAHPMTIYTNIEEVPNNFDGYAVEIEWIDEMAEVKV